MERIAQAARGFGGHHSRPADLGETALLVVDRRDERCDVVDAGRPLDDVGEAPWFGGVDLHELDLDVAPLPVCRGVVERAGLPTVLDPAGQVVVADEERPGADALRERPRCGPHVVHGVGDLDDATELGCAGIRQRNGASGAAEQADREPRPA